jgi:hypothetical protein
MPDLGKFRQVDEYDVINLFSVSGAIPFKRGTFVKPGGSGWRTHETDNYALGNIGASYGNTLSQRWGTQPYVVTASTGDVGVIGLTLFDVREVDENGEQLKFNPKKAAQMQCVTSGQTVPIATRGMFLYSGVSEAVTAGQVAYVSGGQLTNNSQNSVHGSTVGTFLGAKDANGWVLVKINCQ